MRNWVAQQIELVAFELKEIAQIHAGLRLEHGVVLVVVCLLNLLNATLGGKTVLLSRTIEGDVMLRWVACSGVGVDWEVSDSVLSSGAGHGEWQFVSDGGVRLVLSVSNTQNCLLVLLTRRCLIILNCLATDNDL